MNSSLMSFLLVMLIEGICAVANYLKKRLMRHMHQRENNHGNAFDHDPDFA